MAKEQKAEPKKFTVEFVKNVTEPGFYPDGVQPSGLYLQVEHANSKQWIYRYMLHGRRRHMGLGSYPAIGLGEARNKRDDARNKVKNRIDPIEARDTRRVAERATTEGMERKGLGRQHELPRDLALGIIRGPKCQGPKARQEVHAVARIASTERSGC
jgi:hypothetical protein